jgi:hypothetical protein
MVLIKIISLKRNDFLTWLQGEVFVEFLGVVPPLFPGVGVGVDALRGDHLGPQEEGLGSEKLKTKI